MGRLQGKTAVVLGASGVDNMGQCIARRSLAEGARGLGSGRTEDVPRDFADAPGCEWASWAGADAASINALADTPAGRLGGIHIVVYPPDWPYLQPFPAKHHT